MRHPEQNKDGSMRITPLDLAKEWQNAPQLSGNGATANPDGAGVSTLRLYGEEAPVSDFMRNWSRATQTGGYRSFTREEMKDHARAIGLNNGFVFAFIDSLFEQTEKQWPSNS